MRSFSAIGYRLNVPIATHLRKSSFRNAVMGMFTTRQFHSVLLFGDSNTWGYDPSSVIMHGEGMRRLPPQQRWPVKLQLQLGFGYYIIPEGLNSRTTLLSDPASPADGAYNCNGRQALTIALHTHKPLDLVVLALGSNDLKRKFVQDPVDVAYNVRILIEDIKRSGTGTSFAQPPKVLVVGLPLLRCTPISKAWGMDEDIEERSKKTSRLMKVVAHDAGAEFFDIAAVAPVSSFDGVHFEGQHAGRIAEAIAPVIINMLSPAT